MTGDVLGNENFQKILRKKCSVDADSGCWLWLGYVDKENYGRWRIPGSGNNPTGAHQVAYALYKEQVPKGMQLDHTCHDPKTCAGGITCVHRRCVNPEHLVACTPKQNRSADRAISGGWNRSKTHCNRGHEYSEENTWLTKQGHRLCKSCIKSAKSAARLAGYVRVRAKRDRLAPTGKKRGRPLGSGRQWRAETVAAMRAGYLSGKTLVELGLEYGVSYSAIRTAMALNKGEGGMRNAGRKRALST